MLVVYLRHADVGEQIGSDTWKERDIEGQKFSDVHIVDSFEYQRWLLDVWVFSFKVACSYEYTFHGSHSVVIVFLRRELLRTEFVSCDYFSCKRTGLMESIGV